MGEETKERDSQQRFEKKGKKGKGFESSIKKNRPKWDEKSLNPDKKKKKRKGRNKSPGRRDESPSPRGGTAGREKRVMAAVLRGVQKGMNKILRSKWGERSLAERERTALQKNVIQKRTKNKPVPKKEKGVQVSCKRRLSTGSWTGGGIFPLL